MIYHTDSQAYHIFAKLMNDEEYSSLSENYRTTLNQMRILLNDLTEEQQNTFYQYQAALYNIHQAMLDIALQNTTVETFSPHEIGPHLTQ